MANDMRDRLIELFSKEQVGCYSISPSWLADHLIANGVILPPCKVGQVVWVISQWYKYTKPEIESRKVLSVQIYTNGNIQYHYKDGCFWKENIGKTVFLAQEEAEAKLKEIVENG